MFIAIITLITLNTFCHFAFSLTLHKSFTFTNKLTSKLSRTSKLLCKSIYDSHDTVIIGSGIAGLACARRLQQISKDVEKDFSGKLNNQRDFILLEESSRVGGRIGSEVVEGFTLDIGFQVFIEAYPEVLSLFNNDYSQLKLASFQPGALVKYAGSFHRISDPLRRPQDLVASLFNPIGSFWDKIQVGIMSLVARIVSVEEIFQQEEFTTLTYLREKQFLSPSIINCFFKPFYQGIFLSPIELQSSRLFEFVFKMFSIGQASLPSMGGMQSIPNAIAEALPKNSIKLRHKVLKIKTEKKSDDSREFILTCQNATDVFDIRAKTVVIASDPKSAQQLVKGVSTIASGLESSGEVLPFVEGRGSTCIYFAFDGLPPVTEPVLILNGENAIAPSDEIYPISINNVCFPTSLSPSFAPPGKSLASVTVVGSFDKSIVSDAYLEEQIRSQLSEWWGAEAIRKWRLLKIYSIPYAQPSQVPPNRVSAAFDEIVSRCYVIGDHRSTPTLNGAVASGRKVAEAIAKLKT